MGEEPTPLEKLEELTGPEPYLEEDEENETEEEEKKGEEMV